MSERDSPAFTDIGIVDVEFGNDVKIVRRLTPGIYAGNPARLQRQL
jgi:hypothetical protein